MRLLSPSVRAVQVNRRTASRHFHPVQLSARQLQVRLRAIMHGTQHGARPSYTSLRRHAGLVCHHLTASRHSSLLP